LFFISSGFSGRSGVQSDGATIQLARIFTASAPCAVAPARSTAKVSTHGNARMSSPFHPVFACEDTTARAGAATALRTSES
jgi:hypothetical protein